MVPDILSGNSEVAQNSAGDNTDNTLPKALLGRTSSHPSKSSLISVFPFVLDFGPTQSGGGASRNPVRAAEMAQQLHPKHVIGSSVSGGPRNWLMAGLATGTAGTQADGTSRCFFDVFLVVGPEEGHEFTVPVCSISCATKRLKLIWSPTILCRLLAPGHQPLAEPKMLARRKPL